LKKRSGWLDMCLEDALAISEGRDVTTGQLLDGALPSEVGLVGHAGDAEHGKAAVLIERERVSNVYLTYSTMIYRDRVASLP